MALKHSEWLPWCAGAIVLIGAYYVQSTRAQASIRPVDYTSQDAPIGTEIDLPKTDVEGKTIHPSVPTLVVMAGSCVSCSIKDVAPNRFLNAPYEQVVLVFDSTVGDLKKEKFSSVGKVRLVANPESRMEAQFKNVSNPRFYVVADGKLEKVWKDVRTWPKEWTGTK